MLLMDAEDPGYLTKTGDGDYILKFGKHRGRRLSWVVKHDSYWLIEYVLTAYPEIADIVEDALEERQS